MIVEIMVCLKCKKQMTETCLRYHPKELKNRKFEIGWINGVEYERTKSL